MNFNITHMRAELFRLTLGTAQAHLNYTQAVLSTQIQLSSYAWSTLWNRSMEVPLIGNECLMPILAGQSKEAKDKATRSRKKAVSTPAPAQASNSVETAATLENS